MGKINGCLKCVFIFFNSLFAIIGCLLIFAAIKTSSISANAQYATAGAPGLGWIWVFALGILVVSSLGIYTGCTEKEIALKIFAGFMMAGMVVMLSFGIYVAVTRNKIKDAFTNAQSDASKSYMQNEDFRIIVSGIQAGSECCGLSKAEDWGSEIPESCSCSADSGGFDSFGFGGCKDRPQGTTGPAKVYATPCGRYLFFVIDLILKFYVGMTFGFAVTAMFGLLVTMLMLHQVQRED